MSQSISQADPVMDPLVLGLSRPPTIMGVPYAAALLNAVVTMTVFIAFSNLLFLLIAVPVHLVLVVLSLIDVRFLDIAMVVASKCPRSMNRVYWGTQSYAP